MSIGQQLLFYRICEHFKVIDETFSVTQMQSSHKNVKALPGCPDIVLPKYKTVVFVNGCFWHMHDCPRFVWPASNENYWYPKILKNVDRDKKNKELLQIMGWTVLTVWECELKKNDRNETIIRLEQEIRSKGSTARE